jgi:membrane-associated phospholipid phosphatase
MDSVIVFAANYLIYLMVAGFAAYWLVGEDRRGKITLALSAVIGLVLVLVAIKIAASTYYDPRPFTQPGVTALVHHAPDNGFPSDHSAAAGLMATLIVLRHRWWGLLFGLAAAVVAWARVASHVHHLVDVLVGLGLGALTALIAILVVTLVLRHTGLADRLLERLPAARPKPLPRHR